MLLQSCGVFCSFLIGLKMFQCELIVIQPHCWFIFQAVKMDVFDSCDDFFTNNSDWDRTYFAQLFKEDLGIEEDNTSMMELLNNSMDDTTLMSEVAKLESSGPYMTLTEDISVDNDTLLSAVNSIEARYFLC